MPYRPGHSVSHRLVDRIRDKPVLQSLPHMDSPVNRRDIESPTPIEEFSVANQSVTAVREAFGAGVAERRCDLRPKQNLSVIVVDRFPQLFDEAVPKVFGGEAEAGVHEPEARPETQREGSAERVDF